MMLAKAAAKLAAKDSAAKEKDAPWAMPRRDDDLLKKPHGPAVDLGRIPTSRKAPLSFHKPTGRK